MTGIARRRYGRPVPGDIVRIDYHAWHVEAVEDLDVESEDGFTKPYRVEVLPLSGPAELVPHVADVRKYTSWEVVGEHYALCHQCGEVPPCRESERAEFARREAAKADAMMQVLSGCCPACGEPITTRQKTITFDGPNALNPLDPAPRVVFHARRPCRQRAAEYEGRWVRADPSRRRTELTARCSGTVVVHGDGTGECFGRADGADCPTIYARHRMITACYAASHGCGLGCSRQGHPGARLADGLTPAGYRPISDGRVL